MEAKIKTQKNSYGFKQSQKNRWTKIEALKNPRPNFRAIKISRGTTQPGYAGIIRRNYHKSSDCLNSQKKSLLKSTHPKKYTPKFFGPKKNRNWTFHTHKNPSNTHKNPSIISVTWNPVYPPPPPLDGCPLHFRPSEQSGSKFVHNTNKKGHHGLSLILSEDHTWLIFEFFCFEASKPMLVAIVTIIQLIKPEVKIAANQVLFTACSF